MRKLLTLAVVGEKEAGKTRVVEFLVEYFSKKGLRVATAKHIPHEGFSIDTPGKDSWRHRRAGSVATLVISPSEWAIIQQPPSPKIDLNELTAALERVSPDLVVLEGFSQAFGGVSQIPKVVVAKRGENLSELVERYVNAIALVSPEPMQSVEGVPVYDFSHLEELAQRVESLFPWLEVLSSLPGSDCGMCGYGDCAGLAKAVVSGEASLEDCKVLSEKRIWVFVEGKELGMNPFVQEIVRKPLLAAISTLRGVEISGDEVVKVEIIKSGRGAGSGE